MSYENARLCFLSLLIVTISSIFPENLSIYQWNLSSLSENMNFYIFDFNYLRQFHGLFYLYLITNDVSIYKITSSGFWPWIISDMLFKNCIKLHLYWISSSLMWILGVGVREVGEVEGVILTHQEWTTFKEPSSRAIKLK